MAHAIRGRAKAARLALAVCFCTFLLAPDASADWLIVPYLGTAFGGDTNIVDLEDGVGQSKFTFGGSVVLQSDTIFGVEADFGYSSRFFERDGRAGLVVRSHLSTLSGSVIAAVPVAVTRESLRPYVVGGLGLMHVSVDDVLNVFPVRSNLLALNIGGGAIGYLSSRTGLRFEIRQFKNLRPDPAPTVNAERTRLSFWRATAGVVLRY